jgi:GDP-4-dehydro-6-deoxy-D-mannose reductase
MKALITGAAGFAGVHLAEYLLAQGEEVIALIRPAGEDLTGLNSVSSLLRVVPADLLDAERLLQVLSETKPQRLYHLAAMSSPELSFRDPRLTYNVNFGGTLNILSALRRLEMDCRLLYVSSAEVYGRVKSADLPLREETPFRPASPYAGSKAAAELLTFQFFQNYGLPIIRTRPFNHTGPRQSSAFVCSSFARQVAEICAGLKSPLVNVGNLETSRDFSDVRDIVRGYHLLLERGEPGEVYQLGSGRAVAIGEILRTLVRNSPKPIEIKVDPSKVRAAEAPAIWGDISKAARAVGWKPERSLESTLQDLLAYWTNTLRSEKTGGQAGASASS